MVKTISILLLTVACFALGFLYWSSYAQVAHLKAELKQSIKPNECNNFMPKDIEPIIECPKGLTFHRNPENEPGESLVREYCSIDSQDGLQKRVGLFVKRNMSGNVRFKGSYNQAGKVDGLATEYSNNGLKLVESQMLNGEMDGVTTYFRADGSVERKELYKNGVQASGIKTPQIMFSKKRFFECTKNTSCLDFSILSKAEVRIEQWELLATIRNSTGEVIGTSKASGTALDPEKRVEGSFSFPNVDVGQITYYSILPSSVEIQLNGKRFSATDEFTVNRRIHC